MSHHVIIFLLLRLRFMGNTTSQVCALTANRAAYSAQAARQKRGLMAKSFGFFLLSVVCLVLTGCAAPPTHRVVDSDPPARGAYVTRSSCTPWTRSVLPVSTQDCVRDFSDGTTELIYCTATAYAGKECTRNFVKRIPLR
jgi:hypothetical protein